MGPRQRGMPMPSEDLSDTIARTRRRYDETPYLSGPIQRSHPGRLAAIASWRGLAAPEPAAARVLEIGCASGGNLLPLALTLPDASFLGVDLSPAQISAGEARQARLGIDNVEFRAASFESLGEADGSFDFILCHGVYSWIPEPLRDSLLQTIRGRLAPDGVAYVSFNVLPGWRLFQIARDSMLLNARLIDDPRERAAKSRELFALLNAHSPEKHTYGQFWRREAQRILAGGDAYIEHEIFEELNAPETFLDFVTRLGRFDLDYLGESDLSGNNPQSFVPESVEAIEALAGGDRFKRETYVDIFTGRSFREVLIVRGGRTEALAATPPEGTLAKLHFLPAVDLKWRSDDEGPGAFLLTDDKNVLTFQNVEGVAGLKRLVDRKPASSTLEDLLIDGNASEDARASLEEALRVIVEVGFSAISAAPVVCASRLVERPRIWPIAGFDSVVGDLTATLRHSGFRFQPLQRFLASRLDGSNTRDDLVAAVAELAANGQLAMTGPGGAPLEAGELQARLEAAVDQALDGFLRHGLLMAPRA